MADAKLCWPSENPPYKHSVAAYGGNMTGRLGFADYGPHSIKSRNALEKISVIFIDSAKAI